MSGGDIAGLIAASGFVLLVIFIGVPLIKLGKILDSVTDSLRQVTDEVTPLLSELTETVQATNKQLAKVDVITENVSEVTGNLTALVSLFTSSVGGPLVKVAGFVSTVKSVLQGKK